MTVNMITGNVAAFTLKPFYTAVFSDQHVKGAPSTNGNSSDSTGNKKPDRTMSHVVEVYNRQGKVRITFIDSENNAVYQIPSEMVAKVEDQMMKPETSTNMKG